jgi:hypothetical protein
MPAVPSGAFQPRPLGAILLAIRPKGGRILILPVARSAAAIAVRTGQQPDRQRVNDPAVKKSDRQVAQQ